MSALQLPVKRRFSWKTFLLLMALILPASYLVIPFSLTFQSISPEPGDWPVILLETLLNVAIYSALGGIGLLLASRVGLGLPFIEGWLEKGPVKGKIGATLILAVLVGVVASLIILATDAWVFKPLLSAEMETMGITIAEEIKPAPWQGFLASFHGGIVEEVLLRLFVMTLLSWLGWLVFKDEEGRPKASVIWVAIALAAVLFGLAHLPATRVIGLPMSVLVISSTIVLNGIGGVAFGWLYWKHGLESAMIAHFSADIVLHVVTPLVATILV